MNETRDVRSGLDADSEESNGPEPFSEYGHRWIHRYTLELDDWTAASLSSSNFSWKLTGTAIPWAVLKRAWRLEETVGRRCRTCGGPRIVKSFHALLSMGGVSRLCVSCSSFHPGNEGAAYVRRWVREHMVGVYRPAGYSPFGGGRPGSLTSSRIAFGSEVSTIGSTPETIDEMTARLHDAVCAQL